MDTTDREIAAFLLSLGWDVTEVKWEDDVLPGTSEPDVMDLAAKILDAKRLDYVRDDHGRFAIVPGSRHTSVSHLHLPGIASSAPDRYVPIDLEDQEAAAVEAYADDSIHFQIEKRLRDGDPLPVKPPRWEGENAEEDVEPYPDSLDGLVEAMDAVTGRYQVDQPGLVYRGVTLGQGETLKPGMVIRDKGFTSATSLRDVAQGFAAMRSKPLSDEIRAMGAATDRGTAGETPAVLEIVLPKGQHLGPGQRDIGEVVLPRNTRYRVRSRRKNGDVVLDVLPS